MLITSHIPDIFVFINNIFLYCCMCEYIYGPQIFIGSTCNHFCLFNICYKNNNFEINPMTSTYRSS